MALEDVEETRWSVTTAETMLEIACARNYEAQMRLDDLVLSAAAPETNFPALINQMTDAEVACRETSSFVRFTEQVLARSHNNLILDRQLKRELEELVPVPVKRGRGRPTGATGELKKDREVIRKEGKRLVAVSRCSWNVIPEGDRQGMIDSITETAQSFYDYMDEAIPETTYISWVAVKATARKVQGDSFQRAHPNPMSFRRALLQSDQLTILASGCDGISVMQSYWQDIRSLTKGPVRVVLAHNKTRGGSRQASLKSTVANGSPFSTSMTSSAPSSWLAG